VAFAEAISHILAEMTKVFSQIVIILKEKAAYLLGRISG
jgi:hypothetical protein